MGICYDSNFLYHIHSGRKRGNAPHPDEIRREWQEKGGRMSADYMDTTCLCEECIAAREPDKKESVLEKAIKIVNSERQAEYGDPVENRVRAALVAAGMGRILSPRDIVLSELSTKIVRVGRGTKEDTKIDIAGYAEILDRIDNAERNGLLKEIAIKLLPWLF